MEPRIKLVKLLAGQHLEDFLDGNLYLNTCTFFKDLPVEDSCRRDPNEALVEIRQVQSVEILHPRSKQWLKLPTVGPVRGHGDDYDDLNVLCLYMLTDRRNDHFDPRNASFGDTAVIIHLATEFIRRVWDAARRVGWKGMGNPVEYVDEDQHDGAMGPFRKFDTFDYQREYRLIFQTAAREPVRLAIGDLRDIVEVVPIGELEAQWKQMLVSLAPAEGRPD